LYQEDLGRVIGVDGQVCLTWAWAGDSEIGVDDQGLTDVETDLPGGRTGEGEGDRVVAIGVIGGADRLAQAD
jgi:hypothetical protein